MAGFLSKCSPFLGETQFLVKKCAKKIASPKKMGEARNFLFLEVPTFVLANIHKRTEETKLL